MRTPKALHSDHLTHLTLCLRVSKLYLLEFYIDVDTISKLKLDLFINVQKPKTAKYHVIHEKTCFYKNERLQLLTHFDGTHHICEVFIQFGKCHDLQKALAGVDWLTQRIRKCLCCQVVTKGQPTCWSSKLGFITNESTDMSDCFQGHTPWKRFFFYFQSEHSHNMIIFRLQVLLYR